MKKELFKHACAAGILAFSGALFFAGCKKDNANGSGGGGSSVAVPKAGTYTYHVHSSDGTDQDMTGTYSSPRDSAGGKVETLTYTVDTFRSQSTIFVTSSTTTYSVTPPPTYWTEIGSLQTAPGITKLTVSGWPMYITLKNNPTAGDPMTFTGGPVTMHIEANQDNMNISGDWTMKYQNGRAIATNQSVTTDAGTFTCNEWAYETQTSFVAGPMSQNQVLKDTLWYSPQVGMVKSSEAGDNVYATTVLKKIQ